ADSSEGNGSTHSWGECFDGNVTLQLGIPRPVQGPSLGALSLTRVEALALPIQQNGQWRRGSVYKPGDEELLSVRADNIRLKVNVVEADVRIEELHGFVMREPVLKRYLNVHHGETVIAGHIEY